MRYHRAMVLGLDRSKWRCREHMSGAIGRRYGTSSHEVTKSSDHPDWPHPVYVSDRIRDRKSTFLAHASMLPSSSDFPIFMEHLLSLSSLKRATHCMCAYRTPSHTTGTITGQNDGGESGSGDRLSRLLELSGSENVVVVVSRWYGGVKLGSDRWKRISEVAKDVLDKGGFSKKRNANGDTSKYRKKKK